MLTFKSLAGREDTGLIPDFQLYPAMQGLGHLCLSFCFLCRKLTMTPLLSLYLSHFFFSFLFRPLCGCSVPQPWLALS